MEVPWFKEQDKARKAMYIRPVTKHDANQIKNLIVDFGYQGKQLTIPLIENYDPYFYFRTIHIYPLFYLKYKGWFFYG